MLPRRRLFLLLLACNVAWAGAEARPLRLAREGQIGPGIALFIPQDYDPARTPSLAFASRPEITGPVASTWKLRPEFILEKGKAGATVRLPRGVSLYGTGEVTGPLLRNGKSITLWNTDNYAYHKDHGRRLYQSHPWVLGVRADGSAFGVLFDTTWKGELATDSDKIVLTTAGGPFRVAVIDRESRSLSRRTTTRRRRRRWLSQARRK